MTTKFTLNGKAVTVETADDANLLWTLRDHFQLTGAKFGCGIAQCGVCTVHLDGEPVRACIIPLAAVDGKAVTTIEGLSPDGDHPLQRAWIEEQVPQCGYCQPGQIMQAAALLAKNPNPSREAVVEYMDGVICRCGTYLRIIKAIERASKEA
jgi:isoquinoline 1-oxidoreductase alpha subunit